MTDQASQTIGIGADVDLIQILDPEPSALGPGAPAVQSDGDGTPPASTPDPAAVPGDPSAR